jgi:hypothetical protein
MFGLALGTAWILPSLGLAEEQVFRGELAEGDKIHKDQEAFVDYYQVEAEAGKLMTVTMLAAKDSEFDTYLYVTGPSGQELYNDDDYEVNGSRLVFRVPETGEWEIAATALGEEEKGAYTVTVVTQGLKLLLGKRGELEEGDEVLLKEGEYYDKYTLEVEAGKTYVVMAASADFDTFLSVHHPGGLTTNDDSAASYDMSLLAFTPPESGEATIVMTSSYEDQDGRYRLAAYEAAAE